MVSFFYQKPDNSLKIQTHKTILLRLLLSKKASNIRKIGFNLINYQA